MVCWTGNRSSLERWKIASEQIAEFDWWENWVKTKIAYTPSRHFTGRGPFDRQQTLWEVGFQDGGTRFLVGRWWLWALKEIGSRLGPFDRFYGNGQYNELWRQIHLHPEEAVQAALDVNANVATPVHWAGFALALHPWKEPIERFTAEAAHKGLELKLLELEKL